MNTIVQDTNSGVFPNYLNISTTDNKGIGNNNTNDDISFVSVMKNNTVIFTNRLFIKTEVISKEEHLTIAST